MAAAIRNALAHDADLPFVRFDQADDGFQQSGFPAAVGADQTEKIGLVDRQVDIFKDGVAFISGPQPFDFNYRFIFHKQP